MARSIAPQCVDDSFILLIDHDTASVASLTSMLEQISKRVMSVDVASKALSMIEKQKKDIGLVIANIEMPHIDSHSFLHALLQKNIPLILINPETKTKKPSHILTKGACFSLDKPVSENDIKNMWQHVLSRKTQSLKEINMTRNQENVMDKGIDQIEAFRVSLKRQRTSQASLLGRRRPFIDTLITTSETYLKRKSITNVEWKIKPSCPIEIDNKRKESKKVDNNNVGRRKSTWTNERHIKFLAAISILGENEFRPMSILKIMNDPNLTHRQVASHLQKYKAQIDRISDALPRYELKSTDNTFEYPSDYKYPFIASDLTKNLIASNSLWNFLRKKQSSSSSSSSSSSITQFVFKTPIVERKKNTPQSHLDGELDLSNHLHSGNVYNKSSMNVDYVPSTIGNNPTYNTLSSHNANHSGLVSTGFGSENLPILSGLPSNVGALNSCTFQMESIPQYDPNTLHPPRSVLETDVNQIDLDFTSIPDSFADLLPNNTMNPFITNIDQMDWVPSLGKHSDRGTNMNHVDWVPSAENYVPPETDMNINFSEKNTNQMDWVSSGEGYVISENMIPAEVDISQMDMSFFGGSIVPQEETNTNHVGFVSSEIPYEISPKTNMTILETNMKEMSYVPYDKGLDVPVPIEDLISFDNYVIEKDMPSWLEDNSYTEKNNPLSPSYLDRDLALRIPMDSTPHIAMEGHNHSTAMNLGSTSHQHGTMEGGDNIDVYRDCMDWIN